MIPDHPPVIDTTVADPARRYDYWLGGKDNYAADRASGDLIATRFPTIRIAARENRSFMRRAVTHLAQAGIDQFLDIGTGLPTHPNLHEVAHAVNPATKIVYVDNSPLVLVHARALLTAAPGNGKIAYIDGDLRKPGSILHHPDLHTTLDLTRPIALMLIAVLHFITDDDQPYAIVNELLDALPAGSAMAMTHLTADLLPPEVVTDFTAINTAAGVPMQHRSKHQLHQFFTGLTLDDPGIVPINRWRADNEPEPRPNDHDTAANGAVARRP